MPLAIIMDQEPNILTMKKIIITLTAVVMSIASFGQNDSTVTGHIWKPKSFCQLPESINVHGGINYSYASIRGISCQELDTMKSTGVWVTFQGKNVSELHMTSHYENISLISMDGKNIVHPIAYLERAKSSYNGEPEYAYYTSTAEVYYFSLEPKKKYDLFIIFKDAKVGDKIIIDNFLETIITE
jgi:hypothetical protein